MAIIGKDIAAARAILEQGELVGIPTETVYGLAADALNPAAVAKIFEVKNRPQFDPLIVHVPDIDALKKYATDIPDPAMALARMCWPGPLTLLLKKKSIIPDLVTSGLDTVGIRCPQHELTRQLLHALPFPLAAPSANPFGYVSPTTAKHVDDQLGQKIKYILDGGACSVGIESTIVGFEDHRGVVYRLGGLSLEKIESIIGPVTVQLNTSSDPKAPGQLKSHYAPRKKVEVGDISALLRRHHGERVAVLSFQKKYDVAQQAILSPSGNLSEAAQHLFSALRQLDELPVDIILTEWVPDEGIGRAINDRLRRAAHDK